MWGGDGERSDVSGRCTRVRARDCSAGASCAAGWLRRLLSFVFQLSRKDELLCTGATPGCIRALPLCLLALTVVTDGSSLLLSALLYSHLLASAPTFPPPPQYIFAKREHSLLWTSCIAFVRYVREQDVPVPLPPSSSSSSGGGTPPPPPPLVGEDMFPYVSIRSTTPLRVVVEKFVATRVHRLWVLEGARTPTGVLSLTDLLCALVPGGALPAAEVAANTGQQSCADLAGFAGD